MIASWEPPYPTSGTIVRYGGTGGTVTTTYGYGYVYSSPGFHDAYRDAHPFTETEQLIHDFREQLERWLATYNLWAGMSRAVRRAAFLARRLRHSFIERDVHRRRRTCSQSTRWMVTQ